MSAQPRPFVSARRAAELLGVSEAAVIADIVLGTNGRIDTLNGGPFGEAWVVYAYELEGDRLEMHRERLGAAHRDTVANEVK